MYARIQAILHLLYPPRCVSCGDMVETDFGLCGPCWRDTPFITGAVCDICGAPLMGPADGHRIECDACMKASRPWAKGRAAMLYADVGRRIVLALKHGDRQDVVRPAGQWLFAAAKPLVRDGMVVVPVPLHRLRMLKRRFNQSAVLAHAVAQKTGLAICPDLLLRRKWTASLDGKARNERYDTLSDAITVNTRWAAWIKDRPVLLVDDVMTTGATLEACTLACQTAGSGDVHVLALARVAKNP